MRASQSAYLLAPLLLACGIAVALTACLENNNANLSATGNKTGLTSDTPLVGVGTGGSLPTNTTSLLTLARVIRSNTDPVNVFDLTDDGSGAMGQFCVSPQGTPTGPTTCTCAYNYIKADGSNEKFESPTVYHEADLIRCSHLGIPNGVAFVKVQVHLTASDTFSNEVVFRFTGTGLSLDTSNSSSFVQIRRYQCRDAVVVPYLLDGNIYDPFLSDDPDLSYPINFYASNMGAAITAFVQAPDAKPTGSGPGWLCPSVPNDSSFGLDLTVYSVQSDGSSKQIFPPSGSAFDRSTFFLARQKSGVFNVTVNAYEAPGAITSEPGQDGQPTPGHPLPLGYGAVPVPSGNGQEVCPDTSVAIPPGFRWVKVWQFRGSLEDRKVKSSSAVQSLGYIACNPGSYQDPITDKGTDFAIVRACGINPNTGGAITVPAKYGGNTVNSGGLADRVTGTGMCGIVTPADLPNGPAICTDGAGNRISGFGCVTDPSSITQAQRAVAPLSPGPLFAPGTDVWRIRSHSDPNDPSSCASQKKSDPMHLCDSPYFPSASVPYDPLPTIGSLDGGVSRFDFLFVVSPPTVMTQDFKDATNASLPYTPYRYYSPRFCQSPDPDNPKTPGDCASNKIINYGIKSHDVNGNGDAPNNDPGRLPVFPVCALQPI